MGGKTNWRIGLGPVFWYERIAGSRRWQGYALRSLFASTLLVALLCAWSSAVQTPTVSVLRYLAAMGKGFFLAVVGTELALVILAAPAATAGAICLDRARGTLSHMLMTDLSAAEIVLGKLGSRLLPVPSMLVCALPILELLTLLGGVDPTALLTGFVVAASVALVGSSLAMFLSLWSKKTHEALLVAYAFLGMWLLAWPSIELLATRTGWLWIMPSRAIDPFYMALAPYWQPGAVELGDYLWFTGVIGSISMLLVTVTFLRLRAMCTREVVKKLKLAPSRVHRGNIWRILHHHVPWLTPSLDRDPVVWREWHRERPTPFKRGMTWSYIVVSTCASVAILLSEDRGLAAIVNGFQVSIGLLLLAVWSASSLAEERARGSLDLLLCTPLSTRQIVLGKWLGAFRAAPLLAVLPSVVIGSIAFIAEQNYILPSCLMLTYVLCAGGAVISLGILMATWLSRPGRAVSLTVAVYACVAVGSFVIAITLSNPGPDVQQMAMASPFFWAGEVTFEVAARKVSPWLDLPVLWMGMAFVWAVLLLDLAYCEFDRRLGRMEDPSASLGWPSARARLAALGYVLASTLLLVLLLRRDWAFAAAVHFALGSTAIAGMAASTSSVDLIRRAEGELSTSGLMPARVIIVKWLGAFRYALVFAVLPILIMVVQTGPNFVLWSRLLMAICYMFAVYAAATSVGVAMFARYPGSSRAALFAVLISALAMLPWFALAEPLGRTALGNAVFESGPIQAIAGSTSLHASALARASLGIAMYASCAALLLLVAQATLRRTESTREFGVTMS